RDRSAVHRNERTVAARAALVRVARVVLLADPGLAAEQQLDVILRDSLDQSEQIPVRLAHSDPRLCAHPHLRDTDILQSTTSQTTRYLYHLSTTCKLMIDEIGDAWSPAPIRTATRCRTARAPGRSSRRGHVYSGDSTSVPLRYTRILHHRAAA